MPRKTLERMSDAQLIDALKNLPAHSRFRTLPVSVTHADCVHGNPGRPFSCAISTAVRRLLPKASYVCTKHHGLTVTIEGRYLHFAQTQKGSQTIRAFDEEKIKPPVTLMFQLISVGKVRPLSPERKRQVNEARQKRAKEGRPDKVYDGDPLRLRTVKSAKDEVRTAIARAKRNAEKAAA